MKRIFGFVMSLAMVAMAFVGCEKDANQVDLTPERGFELTVLADDVTRTAVDADLMDIVWQADDKARVYIKGTAAAVAATISEEDARIASFVNSLSDVEEGEVLVQAHYPTATIHVGYDATEDSGNRTRMNYVGMNLPKDQTATTTTFDPSADLLVANNLPVTITAEDIEAGSKTVRNFRFNRMVAISRFTYVINNTELSSFEERVNSVSFEVISPNEDKFIAGNLYLQPSETGVSYIDSEQNELTDNKDYFYGNKSNKVTVTLSDQPALKDGFTAWFVTSPVTLSADDQLLFTITTTEGTVIRKTIAAVGREVSFITAKRNEMKVTFGNENVEIEKPSSEEAYVLMTSGTLNVGDRIIIANTSAKSALSTAQQNNNRSATSVQISDDILIPTEDTQIITVEAGTTSGTFAFNVGSGYLYAASSSGNQLKTKTTLDTNGSWSVTVAANGSATVKASGTNTRNVMQYNPNNGNPIFACYASASQSPIAIYRLTTISDGGEKSDQSLAFSESAVTATIGEDFTEPTLSGAKTAVTYTSSDTKVATVDAQTGAVTLVAAGETTITATAAETEEYNAAEASYTLTVNAAQGGSVAYYEKVTSSLSDYTGTYLIVYEAGNVAFDGSLSTLDAVSNTKSVTISNNRIEATAAMDAIAFTISGTQNNYALQSASGYYIGRTSDENGMQSSLTTKYSNSISISSGNADVVSGKAYLRYNSTSGQTRFRYYKSTSYTGQKAIALYKKVEGTGDIDTPEEPEQLATPTNVKATASGKMVTVTWSEVANASSYTVTCEEDGQTKTVTANTAEFTMAAYSTSYTFSVVAKGDGTNYTDSAAATATVTTEADPNVGGGGEAVTATLTNTEIVAVKTSSTSYRDVTITSNSGTWTAKAVVGASFLQINSPNSSSRKGSHVKSPVFSGVISKIVIYTTNSTVSGVTAYICAADYDSSMTSTGVPSGANILTSSATNQVNGTITIDNMESLNLSQFKIFASKALYIDHIEVTYQ